MTKRELFVGRLPSGIEASALRDMFEKFGSLSRCDLKSSSGGTYGFISYDDPKHAEEALKDLHNKDVQGSKINVEWAKSRERGRGERRRYSPRYSPYSSKRRYSRSPSPYVNFKFNANIHSGRRRDDRDRSPRRDDRRDRSPRRRDDRRDYRDRRDDRDRNDRRSRRSRSRSPVSSSSNRRRSRSRSPVEKRDSSRSPRKESNTDASNGNNKSPR
jgi:RNA recognition motif-containing protein